MNRRPANDCVDIVGKFCESGDVLIRDAGIDAGKDDYIAVFSTGAYNYSMSSNYNRTPRPACLLISEGQSEMILRRENFDDLIAHDIVPVRLSDKI
jgi:diaminopimelate decarboxylase